MHPCNPNAGDRNKLKQELSEFKAYLDSEKGKFSQIPELLPFYALLFVPDPQTHSSYKHLFTKQWAADLKSKLYVFLSHFLPPMGPPLLYDIYMVYNEEKGGALPLIPEVRQEFADTQLWVEKVEGFKKREEATRKTLIESQSKWTEFSKGILSVCKKLMTALNDQNCKPETKQNILLESGEKIKRYEKILENNERDLHDIERKYQRALELDNQQRLQNSAISLSQQREDSGSMSPIGGKSQDCSVFETILPELQFSKIKEALIESKNSLKVCSILQALRWRITRTPHGPQRRAVLQSFVDNDLLKCASAEGSIISNLLSRQDKKYG
jgi:hypothetical protein